MVKKKIVDFLENRALAMPRIEKRWLWGTETFNRSGLMSGWVSATAVVTQVFILRAASQKVPKWLRKR